MALTVDVRVFLAESPLGSQLTLPVGHGDPLAEVQARVGSGPLALPNVLFPSFAIDAYCPSCSDATVYTPVDQPGTRDATLKTVATGSPVDVFVYFACSRHRGHVLRVALHVEGTTSYVGGPPASARKANITKIGMLPSLADLQKPMNARYAKVLDREVLFELNRAVGLAAHGVGIGAFVYLRRIFEKVIDAVAQGAIERVEVDGATYERARMDEKIQLLAAHLPPFLVENRSWYGIVSKGIHALSENECLQSFPVVRSGLEIILEQQLETIERRNKEAEARRAIQTLSAKLSGEGQ